MAVKYVSEQALTKTIELTKEALDGKVDKEAGKGLSKNDLTDELVEKINDADSLLEDYQTELGTVAEIKAKLDKAEAVDPAAIQANIESTIATELAKVTGLEWVIPNDHQLPATGESGKIYLIPLSGNGTAHQKDLYEEYVWLGSDYEMLGTTEFDMTGYLTNDDLEEMNSSDVVAIWNK